jgi:type IV secretion system protein VirB10
MYLPASVAAIAIISVQIVTAQFTPQSSDSFSGLWRLNPEQSEIGKLPSAPDLYLKIEQDASSMKVFGSARQDGQFSLVSLYPLDGRSERRQVGSDRLNSATKWEGSSLLVSTLVSGPQNYTVMEYWKRSRSGSKLTITRTIVRIDGESESTLVYENPSFDQASPESATDPSPAPLPTVGGPLRRPSQPVLRMARPAPDPAAEYVVSSGTHVLLRLTSSVNTKQSAAGDQIYMETAAPVYVNGRLVIPVGSYVTGTVTESHQAGRVKGKSGLNLRIDTLTLPNGVARDFRTRVGSAEGSGKVGPEGQIEGSGNKGRDAGTVAQTTAAGAGLGTVIGSASGHAMRGLGIGSAAGAAAGLASIFASRGPNVVLPRGSTLELVLERELRYGSDEIMQRVR